MLEETSDNIKFGKTIKELFNDNLCSSRDKKSFSSKTYSDTSYLFSCNSYEDAYKNYPEYFI